MEEVEEDYEVIPVTEDCSLRSFIEGKNKEYDRGCAYYEHTDKKENIDGSKQVILMDEVSIYFMDELRFNH